MGEEKQFQHRLPKVYLSQWSLEDKIIYIFTKKNYDKKGEETSIDDFGGDYDFYTIENDGQRDIELEDGLHDVYENKWRSVVNKIENNILETKKQKVKTFDKERIIEFIVHMQFRGYKGEDFFREMTRFAFEHSPDLLHNIGCTEKEIKVAIEYIKNCPQLIHNSLKDQMIENIKQNKNKIEKNSNILDNLKNVYIENMNIEFLISSDQYPFITSDNPSFMCIFNKNEKVIMMPITPIILIKLELINSKSEKLKEYKINRINGYI